MSFYSPFSSSPIKFIVRNVAIPKKTIRIFYYPINSGLTRDLMKIEGISEEDIRASLLKGELNRKIKTKDIVIEESDIDLLQFNNIQKSFLQEAGIASGLEISSDQIGSELDNRINSGGSSLAFIFKQNQLLVGNLDGINKIFTVPSSDKFINGNLGSNIFKIQISNNGIELIEDVDYTISESNGSGTGFDTITFISFTPSVNSFLYANYVVAS